MEDHRLERVQSEVEIKIVNISCIQELKKFVKENFSANQKRLWKDATRILSGSGGDETKYHAFLEYINSVSLMSFNDSGLLKNLENMKDELLKKFAEPGNAWRVRNDKKAGRHDAQMKGRDIKNRTI